MKINILKIDSFRQETDDVVIHNISEIVGKNQTYSVSVVVFPPNSKRPMSAHDKDQYVYIIEGKGVITTEEITYDVEKGSLVFIPAGLKHSHGSRKDTGLKQLSIIG